MPSTYIAATVNSTLSASKNHLGLFNAATSNAVLLVYRVEVINHLTAANTGTATSFVLARTTTAGAGTAGNIRQTDTKAQTVLSQVTAPQGGSPTVTANSELAETTIYTEETTGQSTKTPLFQADKLNGIQPIAVREGEGIVIQQSALASAGAVSVFIYFTIERNYKNGI